MRALFIIVLALDACGTGGNKKPAPEPPHDCGERRCIDLARDHERGRGVPRDYAAAYRAYLAGCEAEDALACRHLAIARLRAVGVGFDRAASMRSFERACQLGDPTSCAMVAFATSLLGPRRGGDEDAKRAFAAVESACERGDGDACMFGLDQGSWGDDCGTGCEDEHDKGLAKACRSGSLDGCAELVERTASCGDHYEPALECLEPHLADDSSTGEDTRFAFDRVTAECDDGAAEACAVIPGRAIDPLALCASNDFSACARAAQGVLNRDEEWVGGDGDAGRRACEAGLIDACIDGAVAYRDGATDRTADALALLSVACRAQHEDACELAEAPDLSTGCSQFEPTRIAHAQRTKAPIRPLPALVVTRGIALDDRALWEVLVATAATGVNVYVAVDDPVQVPAGLDGVLPLVRAASAPYTDDDAVLIDDTGHTRASLRIAPYASLPRCVTSLLST